MTTTMTTKMSRSHVLWTNVFKSTLNDLFNSELSYVFHRVSQHVVPVDYLPATNHTHTVTHTHTHTT